MSTPYPGKFCTINKSFFDKNIDLKFLSMNQIVYEQFDNRFVPSLSIIDTLMFNSKETVKELIISGYEFFWSIEAIFLHAQSLSSQTNTIEEHKSGYS